MKAAAIAYEPDPALSFWPTPADVADDLVQRTLCPGFGLGGAAGEVPQVRVLEPSAGDGHLAQAIRQHLPDAHVTCVEPSAGRVARLREQTGLADEVIESTLEEYLSGAWMAEPFDVVVMNPPFTLPGRPEAWAEHFLAIYHDPFLLAPHGQISAVVPRIVMTGKSKLVRQVRELLDPHHGIEECPRGAFDPVGAKLSTALIWIEKVPAPHKQLVRAT